MRAQASKMLRRIVGGSREDDGGNGGGGGVGETKGETGTRGGGSGVSGGSAVISSDQLLDAVNDILGRANMSLSTEQGERLRETLRLKGLWSSRLFDLRVCLFWIVGLVGNARACACRGGGGVRVVLAGTYFCRWCCRWT